MKHSSYFFLILMALTFISFKMNYAQYSASDFSLSLNLNYTTTAKIYLNPRSSDEIIRNSFMPLEQILSPSADFRYRLTEDLFLGLSAEMIEKTDLQPNLIVSSPSGPLSIAIEDGFKLIPLELSAHYLLPFSSETFRLFMGGGLAYYYGEHVRRFGDAEVSNINREFSYGIQFSVSADYMFNNFLSARGEMKFRDPEVEVSSRYNKQVVHYNEQTIFLLQDNFNSKINIDGMTFTIGLAFHF